MIEYSRGTSVHDNHPRACHAETFAEFVEAISSKRSATKETSGYFCGPLNGTGLRCAEGAMPRSWLAVDIDRIEADMHDDVRLWVARFLGCGWPTHSSTPSAPRLRAILALDRDATRQECMDIGRAFVHDLDVQFGAAVLVDPSTFRGEQPLFNPPEGAAVAQYSGAPMAVDAYLVDAAALPPEPAAAPLGARGKVTQDRNAHLSSIAFRLVKKAGLGGEALAAALLVINAQECEPPLDEAEVRGIAARKKIVQPEPVVQVVQAEAPRPEFPEWVRLMREWVPPVDLETRNVEVSFAVEGLIQSGRVGALVAAGGVGKTTLLLHLAICIALGRPFLGMGVTQGTFVLLSGDDTQDDLDSALSLAVRAMRLTRSEVSMVAAKARVFSLLGLDGSRTFVSSMTGPGGAALGTSLPEFVVQALEGVTDLVGISLDTLRQFSGGSSNDEQVIKLTIAGATEIAVRTGAFVILPHHTGKQNYREDITDMYCGSGSAAIADNCRFVLLLQRAKWEDIAKQISRTGREEGDPLSLISTRGSLMVKAPDIVYMHREGFFIGRIKGATLSRDQQADDSDRAILKAVRGGATTKNTIYAVVKGQKRLLIDRIDELEGRGMLVHEGAGRTSEYRLGTGGARFLDDRL